MRTAVFVCSLAVTACSPPSAGRKVDAVLGRPDGRDAADHGCNIVLREVHYDANRGGVETSCESGSGPCWLVLHGTVDLSPAAIAEGAVPMVHYQSGSDPTWYDAPASASDGGVTGYERYTFTLDRHTAIHDQPWPAIALVPYLRTFTGTRLFDHNRHTGDFDNYVLDGADNWAIADDGLTCAGARPKGQAWIDFATDWRNTLSGSLVAGGKLTLNYDLYRMPGCIGSTSDGVQAWDTVAYVRFDPSGAVLSKSIRGGIDASGRWMSQLFTVDVPADATAVEIWFHSSGDKCGELWDSDYGANFRFDVGSQP